MKFLTLALTSVFLITSTSTFAKSCLEYKREKAKYQQMLKRHTRLLRKLDNSTRSNSKNQRNIAADMVYVAIKKEKYEALVNHAKRKTRVACSAI